MISNDIIFLVERYLENRLEPPDGAKLLALLEESDEVRHYFEQEAYSEYLLQSLRTLDDIQNFLIPGLDPFPQEMVFDKAAFDSLNLPQSSTPSTGSDPAKERPLPTPAAANKAPSKANPIWNAMILTVLVLLWGTMIFFEFNPIKTDSVEPEETDEMIATARITQLINAVFHEDSLSVKAGEQLDGGLIALKSGFLSLEYNNGVEVVLEGPFRYRIDSPLNAECGQGRLSVHVPPAGRGFTVKTPKMTVRDIGTDFHLVVEPEQSELHVIQGEVRAHWESDIQWHAFTTGNGVCVEKTNQARKIDVKNELFLRPEQMTDQAIEHKIKETEQWTQTVEQLRKEDPSLKLCIDGSWKPERYRNLRGLNDTSKNLVFTNPDTQIETNFYPNGKSLTLLGELRIHRLNSGANTILSCVWGRSSFLSWRIVPSGALQLLIHNEQGKEETVTFDTPAFLTPQRQKVWFKVATVIDHDQKEIRHYLDGQRLVSFPYDKDLNLVYGDVTLGNITRTRKNNEHQHLNGLLRNVLLFDRVLSEEELSNVQQSCPEQQTASSFTDR